MFALQNIVLHCRYETFQPPNFVHLPSVATLWPYMEVNYIFSSLMQAYSQCEQLLDAETVGGGVFRPDVTDPEMSQACTTSLWELVLFRVCIIVVWRHNVSACHGNFGPAKKLVRGTKIPGIMVRPDHFPLKILVRTWTNSPSTCTMFHRNCRL